MDEQTTVLAPERAWAALMAHRSAYYAPYSAVYCGAEKALRKTAKPKSFWRRASKQKIHVPIAADIATTGSDLLFGEHPKIICVDDMKEQPNGEGQKRLEEILRINAMSALLNEAAESAAALGDVYLKIAWDVLRLSCPMIRVVQGDDAWPEYRLGTLRAIHFFTIIEEERSASGNVQSVIRAYERYEPKRISTRLYRGTLDSLGAQMSDDEVQKLGIEPEVSTGTDEILAVHVPNIKPNRMFRGSYMGRSDYDNLRDLMDALDESYSSWMRDIRLAKARLIVPAQFLRRKPEEMFGDSMNRPPTFEFDEDVETLVALDTQSGSLGGDGESNKITPSQFSIRADEHQKTCVALVREIVTGAGYSPQTFGIDIEGMAQSGTALRIREKKSYSTCAKKQTYWQDTLEGLLTAMLHLDARLYPKKGSSQEIHVHVRFPGIFASDMATTSSTIEMINRAQSASVQTKVRMLHPDWDEAQVAAEVKLIYEENGIGMDEPDARLGDYAPLPNKQHAPLEDEREEQGDE